MENFIYLIKKMLKSIVIVSILTLAIWGTLLHLTDFDTIRAYLNAGFVVCMVNTILFNLQQQKFEKFFQIKASWVLVAGFVLLLYHSGFEVAAVFVAATMFASPFLGATIYESTVGLSLLMVLAKLMF